MQNGTGNGHRPDKKKPKPLLVLVNPTSGTKLARSMLNDILKPQLDKKGIEYELVRTITKFQVF